jgi:phytoene synthase
VSREVLARALELCERIAGKDSSSLYHTSQFFQDRARYEAFIAMYAVMRVVDDIIDDTFDKSLMAPLERAALRREIDAWEARVRAAYAGRPGADPLDVALCAAIETFPVPLALWLAFLDAMRFDIDKHRFDDFAEFLAYGEGATVAPTAIYVYLLTAQRGPDRRYTVSDFDFESCGRDLGLFAYIAHVLRDVPRDLAIGTTGLVYLPTADLAAHGLDERAIGAMVARGHGDDRWRGMVRDLCARAAVMRERGAERAAAIWPRLPVDCAFIFCLIITVYSELLDRIAASPDRALRLDPLLSTVDQLELSAAAARRVGYALGPAGPAGRVEE